jgi:hypothetical protein
MVLALLAAHCILQSIDRVLRSCLQFPDFLSPKTFPAASFTAPLACSAEPLIRSLSIADILVIYLLGVYGNEIVNVNRVSNIAQKCMAPRVTMHV